MGVSGGVGLELTVAVGLGVGVGVAPLLITVNVIVTGVPAVPVPPVALKGVAINAWSPTAGLHVV